MTVKKRICLVDDDASSLSGMKLMLLRLGYSEISAFDDARQAWTFIRHERPSLIISDWNMEPVSGLDLLSLVRRFEPTKHIPFLMVTANTTEDYWRTAIENGATEFLFKPYTLAAFNASVEVACFDSSVTKKLETEMTRSMLKTPCPGNTQYGSGLSPYGTVASPIRK